MLTIRARDGCGVKVILDGLLKDKSDICTTTLDFNGVGKYDASLIGTTITTVANLLSYRVDSDCSSADVMLYYQENCPLITTESSTTTVSKSPTTESTIKSTVSTSPTTTESSTTTVSKSPTTESTIKSTVSTSPTTTESSTTTVSKSPTTESTIKSTVSTSPTTTESSTTTVSKSPTTESTIKSTVSTSPTTSELTSTHLMEKVPR
ncbi:unnamed protein product [Calicophoron daubneyi]|uniref:Uncharacterized protein n=1 Tax=Calicophoron daubneyi TaxID=300641 RepID=A0AAV2TMS3_CALDB